ncbi:hypothetical protein ACKAV7_001667 [Fusarium commune]
MNINDMLNPDDPGPNDVAKEFLDSLQTNNDMENLGGPDRNAAAEGLVDSLPDPETSQAESPEAQNTGSNQGVTECTRRASCKRPSASGRRSCEECLKYMSESNKSAERNLQI